MSQVSVHPTNIISIIASRHIRSIFVYIAIINQSVHVLVNTNIFNVLCSCGCAWCDGEASDSCVECGGFAMYRPCPLCHGECGALWTRSVDMVRLITHASV